ncbi:ACT domain-containing protein [Salinibacterium sp. TMP30]|uniref:ACT domain-containing protein n=1 Tax=Salinibacterium sp. TMP30 TaxID=3138237 RepID=UPI003138E1AF
MSAISDLDTLVSTMDPQLKRGVFVFATVASLNEVETDSVVAMVVETEGISVVMSEADAALTALQSLQPASQSASH